MTGKRIVIKGSARRLRDVLWATGLVAATIAGCSSGDERKRAASLAGGCSINSDCEQSLICAFGRCHKACDEDRDCFTGLRCVKSEERPVCQLPEETECKINDDCKGDQICGVDDECRDACEMSTDCVGDQRCDVSGACASTDPSRDALDSRGRLVAAEPEATPGAGGAGDGSHQGGEGSGAPNVGGTGAVDTQAHGGDASTTSAGAPGEGGSPSNGSPAAEFEEQAGVAETVDNDFREDAIPITTAVNIYLSKKSGADLDYDQDADWFSFAVPDDGRGHVITIRMEQEASLQMTIKAFAQVDGTEIGAQTLEMGTLRYAYVTAGSGTTTLFRFSNHLTAGSKGMAFITFEEEAEDDDHEPNNEKTSATSIALDEPTIGQALNPFVSESVHPNQDWFSLNLAVGTATVTLNSAPVDARLELDVLAPNQGQPTLLKRPEAGSTGAWSFNVTTAGTHYIVVQPSPGNSALGIHSFDYLTKPDYMQTPYSFTVTQ